MSNQSTDLSKTSHQVRPIFIASLSVLLLVGISWGQSRLVGTSHLSGWTGFIAGSWTGVLVAIGAYMLLPKRARLGFLTVLTALCLAFNIVGYSLRVELLEHEVAITDSRPIGESAVQAARLTSYSLIPGHLLVPFPRFIRDGVDAFFPPAPKLRAGEYPLQMADVGVFVAPALALNVFLTLLVVVGFYSTLQRRLRAA